MDGVSTGFSSYIILHSVKTGCSMGGHSEVSGSWMSTGYGNLRVGPFEAFCIRILER